MKGLYAFAYTTFKDRKKVVKEALSGNKIPFNKPYVTGHEKKYVDEVLVSGNLCGGGAYTEKCHNFFKDKYSVKECFLTSSCSDALEMSAILLDIQPGDEVIMPSYTFVSTANAFMLRGADVVFADSREEHPGINEDKIEELITPKTKAIVVVHYAGVACDMDKVMDIAKRHNLYVVEDAAQAIDAYYKGRPLGTIGHLGTMSFHETKNIVSGEGGLLMINDDEFIERAEIIREKGTDRSKFIRGEVDKYGWVDVGSSFLPSELTAAFLYAQLERLDTIQRKRRLLWNSYYKQLKMLEKKGFLQLPSVPDFAEHNAHIFYIVLKNEKKQEALRGFLKAMSIDAVFHYNPLHRSSFFEDRHDGRELKQADRYDVCLLRLPLYADMTKSQQNKVIDNIWRFFTGDN